MFTESGTRTRRETSATGYRLGVSLGFSAEELPEPGHSVQGGYSSCTGGRTELPAPNGPGFRLSGGKSARSARGAHTVQTFSWNSPEASARMPAALRQGSGLEVCGMAGPDFSRKKDSEE